MGRHLFRAALFALGLASTLVGCQTPPAGAPFPSGRLVDLTHAFDDETLYWPTAPGFELHSDFEGTTDGGWFYESNTLRTSEHGGTHLDAPVHFARGRHATDEIPLERLIAPAVVVDVSRPCADDPDYAIPVSDLTDWETRHGRIPDGVILLFHTGFAKRWPDAASYLGTSERGADAVAKLHFPGISPAAARWLADERDIAAVGIDTASIDPGQSTSFEAHRILYEKNVPGFENLADLSGLPAVGATVIALPMKIRSGSGGPLRIVAILP